MEQQPLLTHDQLVDWLIYHVPLEDNKHLDKSPFYVEYRGRKPMLAWALCGHGATPWEAYDDLALELMRHGVHREITDLYWYWTIE